MYAPKAKESKEKRRKAKKSKEKRRKAKKSKEKQRKAKKITVADTNDNDYHERVVVCT